MRSPQKSRKKAAAVFAVRTVTPFSESCNPVHSIPAQQPTQSQSSDDVPEWTQAVLWKNNRRWENHREMATNRTISRQYTCAKRFGRCWKRSLQGGGGGGGGNLLVPIFITFNLRAASYTEHWRTPFTPTSATTRCALTTFLAWITFTEIFINTNLNIH